MPKGTQTKAYGPSKTIPGQSLYPAELMKRHLAGTLPDIDLSAKYEYHYDEDGNQIAEPMPKEMYEVHALAVAIRRKQFEVATEHRKQQAEKERAKIIDEYKAAQALLTPHPTSPEAPTPTTSKPKQPRRGPTQNT